MKYCEHCGSELKSGVEFCPNCGAKVGGKKEKVAGEVVKNTNTTTTGVKDNTTAAFVCSIIGALCCTYVAIPGLILSIMALKDMKEGKISSEKKWMAIV
ncbi:MAG: zinc-ribbon domain-containing protein [Bacilli bacterium]|nr:zinc-ribbon domain-containing protein [Bacilli bacterium]